MCPLHGPGHDINLCNVMQAQSKAMKSTWSTTCGNGAGCMRLQNPRTEFSYGQLSKIGYKI